MPDSRKRPIPNCYWLPGEPILAGEYPGAVRRADARKKLGMLAEAGVSAIIDLTREEDGLAPYASYLAEAVGMAGTVRYSFPIQDLGIPTPGEMARILDLIDELKAQGRTVYVHCWGGVGRTGTVVGCYLVRRGLTGEEALKQLAESWKVMEKRPRAPRSPETDEQREFVLEWQRHEPQRRGEAGAERAPEFFRGCLLGGAVGDALGAPVEFLSLKEIRARFGPADIQEYTEAYGRVGAITDDTQMTLFTAEGLLRAVSRYESKGICHPPSVVHHAYVRWLHTQGERSAARFWEDDPDGWLISIPELYSRRVPGSTCLAALRGPEAGSVARPLNDSKGCGGVMRAAPAGLIRANAPFELGRDIAAITHGHPSGYLAAGCLSLIIHELIEGRSLEDAVGAAQERVKGESGHEECSAALASAVLASRIRPPSPETVERLGQGWVAEEALGIAVYCALSAGKDFAAGVCLAVNHGGDSDSTGAIAGASLARCWAFTRYRRAGSRRWSCETRSPLWRTICSRTIDRMRSGGRNTVGDQTDLRKGEERGPARRRWISSTRGGEGHRL